MRSSIRRWRLVAFLGVLAAGVACVGPGASQPAPPNIVFVLIDTLRSDHLGCYGYDRATSPFIDELAASGMLFERAFAQAPWTAPSVASIFTSRYPSELGVGALEDETGVRHLESYSASGLGPEPATLAEALAAAGYRTIAATANVWASDWVGMLRGFGGKDDEGVLAEEVVDRTLALLEPHLSAAVEGTASFFAYVHLVDPHMPTDPPAPYDTTFPTVDGKPHTRRHAQWYFGSARGVDSTAFDSYRSHKLALYDGSIAYVDAQLRRLHEALARTGVADRTVWVIASDHGEEFWDSPEFPVKFDPAPTGRGAVGHGHSLLAEVVDVPLIVAGDGVPSGRVPHLVRNLDIAPTILGLAGVKPPSGFGGIDLLRAHRLGRLEDLPGISEDIAFGHAARSLQDGRYKYIVYPRHPQRPTFVFDLLADPAETANLAETDPDLAASLDTQLSSLARTYRPPERQPPVTSPAVLKKLRALGYVN
jgi:arylsulfatase A-like enzyme